MKLGIIITPERKRDKIIQALKEEQKEYTFINLLEDDWLTYFQGQFDGYIIYPPSFPYEWQNTFFKRLYYVNQLIDDKVTPNLNAISMYESKIAMHDFYKVFNIPHIESRTFYNRQKALEYAHGCELPVVVKEDGGSGAVGVKIIKDRSELVKLVRKSFYFSNKIKNKFGFKKIKSKLYPYKVFIDTKRNYLPLTTDRKGFIHIQTYKKVKYEWRIIRIGKSYFGHKKIENAEGYHSGTLNKEWGKIPTHILDLVKEVSDKTKFDNMSFDIFQTEDNELYFNEFQVIFGTSTEEQLIINGVPGRYVYKDAKWLFQKGDFTRNGCNNLRVQLIMNKIKEGSTNDK